MMRILSVISFCLFLVSFCFGQNKPSNETTKLVKSTPAYAELLLRKVELESDVESFLESYTEEFPKLKEARYELELTKKDLARLLTQTDASRLTSALGRLLVRKNEVETELWTLQNRLDNSDPQVKRAQRKALNFQNAIKEILP